MSKKFPYHFRIVTLESRHKVGRGKTMTQREFWEIRNGLVSVGYDAELTKKPKLNR